ncbi:DNA helicase [Bacteroidia bacterium]|nr:DNA helicase [Bacteroidia bacterium]
MLIVYRASAGAGKTHKLTGEYLKLLFKGTAAYRHILAVTFTNKATDEMKRRIIEELHKLASGQDSQYVDELSSEYELNEQQARKKAKGILTAILHDYGAFNISTIDRFFQQTMRAFTREIGMQGGYAIEMDQDLVLSEAIDNLLGELEKPGNKELLDWLLRFAAEKVEDGGSWNPRKDILSLGKELFKESYKASSTEVSKDIEDKGALDRYKNELYAIVGNVESHARQLGERAMNQMNRSGLQPSDFIKKSASPLFTFARLAKGEMKEPTATFTALADNVAGWYAKSTPPDMVSRIENACHSGLNDCVKETLELFARLTDYRTAKEILRFYYTLGILTDVSNQIAAYRSEKNIMLIADTTELLSKIIDGSDTPFIYEKTGVRIDHYMIDEFQDTSRMQWCNFRPLLNESLAHGHGNLVVGDVKQSIYRFRNSDWKLLDEQIQKDFRLDQVGEETLEDNWRSSKEIITFNNTLFETAPALLQASYNETLESSPLPGEDKQVYRERVVTAYSHSRQSVPPPLQASAGHVAIDFLPDEEGNSWREESLRRLPAMLERLQDTGYSLQDIAILVRTNREGAFVADSLLACKEENPPGKYRYDIISDDALFVGSSSAVRFLLSMLKHLNAPGSLACKQIALFAYSCLSEQFTGGSPLPDFPPRIRQELDALSKYALYETIEGLFRLFSGCFPANEQVFVQAFLDMALEFAQKDNADTERFLRWWDDTGSSKTIATPDGQNAIRILTIHKSKGLGFKVVILPFCDWELDHKPTKPVILWCRPSVAPFNRLHLVPLNYSRNLALTHFAKDYFEERLQAAIDNLNTLYVAFTRAKEELLVIAPQTPKANSIAGLLRASLEKGFGFQAEDGSFEQGRPTPPAPGKGGKDAEEVEEIEMGRLCSVSPHERLRLRLHSEGFTLDDLKRKHGALMHEILSAIRTTNDIAPAIESYRLKGIINKSEAASLAAELERLLQLPEAAPWFDGSSKVMNEVEILSGKGSAHRPDRVMIKDGRATVVDYKFGEQESPRHTTQVRNYLQLIRQMGYSDVKGYLWYITLGKIESINN